LKLQEGIAVGRVLRPWGRHGAVVVQPLTHDPDRFHTLRRVFVRDGDTIIEHPVGQVRFDRLGRAIVQLASIASISSAEELRGAELLVPEKDASPPPTDAYFNHDLVGCDVTTASGDGLGQVVKIVETDGANLLVVRDRGEEIMIPAARSIVVEVDVSARRIVVDPPIGLIELNRADESRAV